MRSLLPGLAFWIKTTLAYGLCVWVAFELSITLAGSAALTVMILSDPDSGAVFSKSKWRFVGTIFGGLVFVGLAIPFMQAPWLFMLGLAIWSGICYYVSCYYRYFQAYGALLAGYTATIVLSEVAPTNTIVFTAIERVSEVSLGVIAVALTFGLTHIRKGIKRLEPEMHLQAKRILDIASGMVDDPSEQNQAHLVRQWVKQTDDLQRRLLMLGEEESIYSKQAKSIRIALMDLFAPIAKFSDDFQALVSAPATPAMLSARSAIIDCLQNLFATNNAPGVASVIKQYIPPLRKPLEEAAAEITDPQQNARILAIQGSLEQMLYSLHQYRRVRQDPNAYSVRKFGKIVEQRISILDAVGVAVGYLVFTAAWIGLEWQYGLLALMQFTAVVMLQLANDRPVLNVIDMLKGLFLASIFVYPVKFLLMPMGEGLAWLLFCIGLILLPGCLLRGSVKYMAVGSGAMLFGGILLGVANNMVYDFNQYLNMSASLIIGTIGAIVLIAVIHPWRGETRLNMLIQRALNDFEHAIKAVLTDDHKAVTFWEDRQFARVRQLDHIAMLRKPAQADDAARRLIHMVDAIRSFQQELKHIDHSNALDKDAALRKLRADITHADATDSSDIVGSWATGMVAAFRQSDAERANAWQCISDQMMSLERRLYA